MIRSVLLVSCVALLASSEAKASAPGDNFPGWSAASSVVTSIAPSRSGGFWIQYEQTAILTDPNTVPTQTIAVGGAPEFPSVGEAGTIVAAPYYLYDGYWVVTKSGKIYWRGDKTVELCGGDLTSCSAFRSPNEVIVGAAATPSGKGLWALDRSGHVWTAGDAVSYGDASKDPVPATGIVGTPSGKGYYIVKSDGGVFSFGDAVFFGSTGGKRPGGHDISGIAISIGADGKANGYWLLGVDGAVYSFGQAQFWGNAGVNDSPATHIVSFPLPVEGMPVRETRGYAWVLGDGGYGVAYRP
jgi:hypothetical protein